MLRLFLISALLSFIPISRAVDYYEPATGTASSDQLQAPTVSAPSYSDATTTSTKLNGIINPNGTTTYYQFQYADNSSFSGSTLVPSSAGNIGSGTNNVSVSQQISSLTPGKTYYYRLAASNTTGANVSTTQSFKTANVTKQAPTMSSKPTPR